MTFSENKTMKHTNVRGSEVSSITHCHQQQYPSHRGEMSHYDTSHSTLTINIILLQILIYFTYAFLDLII